MTSLTRRVALAASLVGIAAIAFLPFAAARDDKPHLVRAGSITISQTQVALLVSGNGGGGVLTFRGRRYPFKIAGLGVGGIGMSKITATGTVYNMTDISQFAGTYGSARWGYAAGDKGKGKIWLERTGDHDVVIHLNTHREGLMLSLGADLVQIDLK